MPFERPELLSFKRKPELAKKGKVITPSKGKEEEEGKLRAPQRAKRGIEGSGTRKRKALEMISPANKERELTDSNWEDDD